MLDSMNSATAAATSTPPATLPSQQLNEADFLQLLTTQLQDQDPTTPMDPSQFASELAQFSQVDATEEMQTSLSQLSTSLSANQMVDATRLIGQQVLVPSSQVTPAAGGVSGAVNVPSPASDVRVTVTNAAGEPVETLDLGSSPAGMASFHWDGLGADGSPAPAGQYTITATDGSNQLATYVAGTVTGVGNQNGNTTLQVQGVGSIALNQVAQIL